MEWEEVIRLNRDLLRLLLVFQITGMFFTTSVDLWAGCNIVNGRAYGDCDGITIQTKSKGHLTVRSEVYETGVISGATVKRGGALALDGVCHGSIMVENGGKLTVGGVVSGTIINRGGYIEIEGTAGSVQTTGGKVVIGGVVGGVSGGGTVKYRKGAVVSGVPHN